MFSISYEHFMAQEDSKESECKTRSDVKWQIFRSADATETRKVSRALREF